MSRKNRNSVAGAVSIAVATDVIRDLDSFSSVGAGQTANVQLPVGPTYDEIHLEFSGVTRAQLTGIRLSLNADDIIDVTADELVMIEAYKGNAEVVGSVTIGLREIMARTMPGTNLTGLVTLPRDVITIEVDIDVAAVAPVLKGWYVASPRRAVRKVFPRLKRFSFEAGAAGTAEFTNLPRGNRVKRLFIGGGVGVIDSLELERNQIKIWKQSKTRNDYQQGRYGLVPQAGYFVFDAIYDGFAMSKPLVTAAQSFIMRFNVSTLGTLPILVESIEAQR